MTEEIQLGDVLDRRELSGAAPGPSACFKRDDQAFSRPARGMSSLAVATMDAEPVGASPEIADPLPRARRPNRPRCGAASA